MKSLHIAEDILPMAEFKAQASRVFRRLREEGRPMVITQNGRPAGVLIPPQEFDRWQEQERFLSAVREGLADAEAGRLTTDEEMTAELDRAFGPL